MFRTINILLLLTIFLLFFEGYIKISASYYFGIAIVSILLVNFLPIIMKEKQRKIYEDPDKIDNLGRKRYSYSTPDKNSMTPTPRPEFQTRPSPLGKLEPRNLFQ